MVYEVYILFEDENEEIFVGLFTTKLKALNEISRVKKQLKKKGIEYESVVMYENELDKNYWIEQCF
jgi:hypothetical protein